MDWDIALELGDGAVRLATKKAGLTVNAPSCGAWRGDSLIALGDGALALCGREPVGVHVTRPMRGGSIAHRALAGQWIEQLLSPHTGGKLIKPGVLCLENEFTLPSERAFLSDAVTQLGAGQCAFLKSSLAAACGAGLDIKKPQGFAVAEVGAGKMGVSLICYGRIIRQTAVPFGMDKVNESIMQLLRSRAALSIGHATAEDVKMVLASALPAREVTSPVRGLDMATGFPGEREISAYLVKEAVNPIVDSLSLMISQIIQDAPEDIAADLMTNGVMLTGGGALLSGLDKALTDRCGLACHIPESPSLCTGKGMARILQDPQLSEMLIEPYDPAQDF